MIPIGSDTVGDPDRFRSLADLREMLMALPAAREDKGHVALLMRRCDGGRREVLERIGLMPEAGIPGDAWVRAAQPKHDMQIAVMQKDVAELIANGQPLTLFGDCLILDLDLSAGNLPAGSRLRVGSAILEVTPEPHNGCRKFRARFGDDALRFVSARELRHRNLRGIYMCVAEGGEVKTGDPVDVMFRPSAPGGRCRASLRACSGRHERTRKRGQGSQLFARSCRSARWSAVRSPTPCRVPRPNATSWRAWPPRRERCWTV